MAEAVLCEVSGCGRKFVPGKSGAAGRCGRHYRLKVRNSPNADKPGPLRGRNRTEKLTTYVDPDVSSRVAKLAHGLGRSISDWIADQLPPALDRDEKKLKSK